MLQDVPAGFDEFGYIHCQERLNELAAIHLTD
jgi:acyl-homoserine lactone acylase PvdQ